MSEIRNFCIIAHIDHGKSTLADRFLELTGTIPKERMREQYLSLMDLEREKGITIKMRPVRMEYALNAVPYTLNLIDTPGHVDFNYEVSRSLAAVEGAILLVDATKGIQAQTISNLELAKKQNLVIIPVVNKIDLPNVNPEERKKEIADLLGIEKDEVLSVSGKLGTNAKELLEKVIEKVPKPQGDNEKPFRALIFDSQYESFKGVIAYIRVIDGQIKSGEQIYLIQTETQGHIKELGYFKPELKPAEVLKAGEIGYLATGIKEPGRVRVGDTITSLNPKILNLKSVTVEPLPGYKEPKPMVFASIFPENLDDFEVLKEALSKLKLNDASLTFEPETKESLGRGFRCGFLGSLHTEIVSERLKREFGLNLVISTPSVVFKIQDQRGGEFFVYSASDWPEASQIKEIKEPWVKLEIITPNSYLGRVLDLLRELKGKSIETKYLGTEKLFLTYEVPFKEIIAGFYDNLKSITQGFASMNYEFLDYRLAKLVKLDILIAGKKEEAFSKIVYEDTAFKEGRKIVEKLKEILPSQLFSVPIQAAISGKIVARETISAKRRDVIAPLYGGDYTRKRKLLEQQKKGKKKLKERGNINIPPEIYLKMFRS